MQRKRIWEVLERSAPILIGEEVWFVRVLYKIPTKTFYFDIRRHEREELNDMVTNYNPVPDDGITLELGSYFKLFECFLKLSNKWKEQIKKQEERNKK